MSTDNTKTVKLETPIKFGENETITELKFRPATGADLEDYPVSGATIGDYLRIAARLTDKPKSALTKATGKDALNIAAAVESQLTGGPPTGGT